MLGQVLRSTNGIQMVPQLIKLLLPVADPDRPWAGFLSGGRGEHLPPLALPCPPGNFFESESIQVF